MSPQGAHFIPAEVEWRQDSQPAGTFHLPAAWLLPHPQGWGLGSGVF